MLARPTLILAIDTSTEQASVALTEDETIRAEWSWTAQRNHSRHLTRVVRELLALEGIHASALAAITVACGPGSFSGVRVGVSYAKGLAMALSIPVVGISTLDVIGFQASAFGADVWALTLAGRGMLNLAHYQGSVDDWGRMGDYLVVTPDRAAELVGSAALLAGPGAELVAATLARRGHEIRIACRPWQLRRAGYLAELGRRYLDAGGEDQLDSLEPIYLRRPAAEEKQAASRPE